MSFDLNFGDVMWKLRIGGLAFRVHVFNKSMHSIVLWVSRLIFYLFQWC